MRILAMGAVLTAFAMPAFAEGDADAGQSQFARQCVNCHLVQDDQGVVLAGRNGRTGPNLFHMPGGVAGTVEGFRYSDAVVAWGEQGGLWDEESFVAFVMNPTAFLRAVTENPRARSKMSYNVRDEQQARDIYAFLLSLNPDAAGAQDAAPAP